MPFAKYYELLQTYISFQTLQNTTNFISEAEKTIQWFSDFFSSYNFEVHNHLVGEVPILVAKKVINQNLPTCLIWTNYDLVMGDVSSDWKNNPFHLYLGKEEIIGKGVAENKGQFLAVLMSIIELIKDNKLGYNLVILIDGTQNKVGTGLQEFLKEKKEELKADFCFTSFGDGVADLPTIQVGQRGGMNFDIILSGEAENPMLEMSKLLSKCYTFNGKIAIPYFYYNVEGAKKEVEAKRYGTNLEFKTFVKSNKPNYAVLEPVLELTGIVSLPNFEKSYLAPQKVVANLQMGLVHNQKVSEVIAGLQQWLKMVAPVNLKMELLVHEAYNPLHFAQNNFYVQKAFSQVMKVFGETPVQQMKPNGLKALEGIQNFISPLVVSLPFAGESSNIGKANENLSNEQVKKIFEFCMGFFGG